MSASESTLCRSRPWTTFARLAILPWALQGRRLSGDVLEIGGGSAAMAAAVLQRCPDVRLVVTDCDPVMVRAARRRLSKYGDRIDVHVADATALSFPDETFDAVLSFLMLHHTIEWERAIAEAARVLRPGGWLIGYDLLDSAASRWVHRIDGSAHRLFGRQELRAVLSDAPWGETTVRLSRRTWTVRFAARRQ